MNNVVLCALNQTNFKNVYGAAPTLTAESICLSLSTFTFLSLSVTSVAIPSSGTAAIGEGKVFVEPRRVFMTTGILSGLLLCALAWPTTGGN